MRQDEAAEELLRELGVEVLRTVKVVGCGEKAPPMRKEGWKEGATYEFEGYLARVVEVRCQCRSRQERLEGIFAVEREVKGGGRRMTALVEGAQWDVKQAHKVELRVEEVKRCWECVGWMFIRAEGE